MAEIIRVKPAGHNLVRNPDAAMRHLDPAGEPVEMSTYWRRRIKDGDVVKVVNKEKTNGNSV